MKTVLIIDDEPDIVFMVRLGLELAGFRVVDAESGEAGLAAIEREDPDAVLLDLRLPDIDGWTVFERVVEAGTIPGSKVIVISAHSSPGTPVRARDAGCGGYLRKPFHPDELLAMVRSVVVT